MAAVVFNLDPTAAVGRSKTPLKSRQMMGHGRGRAGFPLSLQHKHKPVAHPFSRSLQYSSVIDSTHDIAIE